MPIAFFTPFSGSHYIDCLPIIMKIKQLFSSFLSLSLMFTLSLPYVYAAPDNDPILQIIEKKQAKNKKDKKENTDELAKIIENKANQSEVKKADTDELLSSAMGFLGLAYRFGGTTPSGFDCSGFMQYIFKKAYAINLPRTSAEQASAGMPVERADLQVGDLVFFRTSGNRISHVGMYIGNDRFIHAPRTGKSIEITSLSSKYWNSKYATARRVKR